MGLRTEKNRRETLTQEYAGGKTTEEKMRPDFIDVISSLRALQNRSAALKQFADVKPKAFRPVMRSAFATACV